MGSLAEFGVWLHREVDQVGGVRRAAELWNIDKSIVSKFINGHFKRPELATFQRLAQGMGEPLAKLLEIAGIIDRETDPLVQLMSPEQLERFVQLPPSRRIQLMEALLAVLHEDDCR